jgi:hypothetical protein
MSALVVSPSAAGCAPAAAIAIRSASRAGRPRRTREISRVAVGRRPASGGTAGAFRLREARQAGLHDRGLPAGVA